MKIDQELNNHEYHESIFCFVFVKKKNSKNRFTGARERKPVENPRSGITDEETPEMVNQKLSCQIHLFLAEKIVQKSHRTEITETLKMLLSCFVPCFPTPYTHP